MSPAVARRGVPGRGGARARGSFGGRVGRVRARAHLLGFVLVLLVLVVALARHLRHEAEGDVAIQPSLSDSAIASSTYVTTSSLYTAREASD